MTTARVFAGACLVAFATGCDPAEQNATPAASTAALTEPESDMLFAWLECTDCLEAELDSVVAIATRRTGAVDSLDKFLREGPPPTRRQSVVDALGAGFDRDTAYANRRGIALDSAGLTDRGGHVTRYTARYEAVFRSRAVVALGCVHSPAAVAILSDTFARRGLDARGVQLLAWARDSLSDPAVRSQRCRSGG